MTQVVYVDVLFAINFVVNYFLLLGSSRLARERCSRLRLFCGALLGAFFSLGIFLPQNALWATSLFRLAAAAGMVAVTFPWQGIRKFSKELLIFFCSSFLFAGGMLALWMAFSPRGMIYNSGVVYFDIRPVTLIAATAGVYLLLCGFQRVFHREQTAGEQVQAVLYRGEKQICLPALWDTGNHLREPFSGLPVALCGWEDAQELLTQEERLAVVWGDGYPSSLRQIPYRDASGTGLLPAVRLDRIEILRSQGSLFAGDCFLAVSKDRVGTDAYRLILPPEILHVLQ